MTAKYFRRALALFFLMALALATPATGLAGDAMPVKLIPMLDGYPAGQSEPLFLMTRLPEGMAPEPGKSPALNVTLQANGGVQAEQAALLSPRSMPGIVVIIMGVTVADDVQPGSKSMKGKLLLQPPSGQAQESAVEIDLNVLPKGSQAKEINPGMVGSLLTAAGLTREQIRAAGNATQNKDKGFWEIMSGAASSAVSGSDKINLAGLPLWLVLLLAFGTGIVLNATPCVYPLIPITVSFFGGRAQGNRGMLLAHVLAYWAGMAVMYSVLGALAALSGRMLGDALTNPLVLIVLAAVFLALAASMFGLWEIRMPGAITQAAAANRAGVAGSLLMGLLVGVLAAPCVGPVVVAFIALVARVGDVAYGLSVFFALAVGLGLPLSVLAFFSGSISRLPGAGAWMVWVRAFFGVVLVGMAWFVVRPLVSPEGFFWVMAFICLAGGVYLGFVKLMGSPAFRAFSRVVGVAIILAPALFWWLGIFTPPPPAEKIVWLHYSQAEVDKAAGKPKVLLFSADWCAPCRQLKAQTFPDPRVQQAMSGFVALKADMTTGGDEEAKKAARQFFIRGVPTMVFLDQNGKPLTQFNVVGFMPPGAFADRLNAVLRQIGAASQPSSPPAAKQSAGG